MYCTLALAAELSKDYLRSVGNIVRTIMKTHYCLVWELLTSTLLPSSIGSSQFNHPPIIASSQFNHLQFTNKKNSATPWIRCYTALSPPPLALAQNM